MTVRPIEEAKKVTYDFVVVVSPEYVEESIDTLGIEPPREWEISFDLEDVAPALRRRLRLAYGRYTEVEPYPNVPRPIDDPEEFLDLLEPWLDQVEADEAEADKNQSLVTEAEEAMQRRFKEEMTRWSEERGSLRLRAALDRGYRVNTTYAVERAAQEFPGFWVDTADDIDWGERTDPTQEALELEAAVEAHIGQQGAGLAHRIVWLEEAPRALGRSLEEQGEVFEPQEAVIIPGYLDRYTLVLPVDPDLRSSDEGSQ